MKITIARRQKLLVFAVFSLFVMITMYLFLAPAYRFLTRLKDQNFSKNVQQLKKVERFIPEANLNVHIYKPFRRGAISTIVIIPGLHPNGIHDPRYQAFLSLCANEGFQVIAPDIVEFRNFKITLESVDMIANLIKALPKYVDHRSLNNLGLIGISYGAGPVFIAAARDDLKNKIHFIGSVGGYYNLLHAMDFALTGIVEVNGRVQFRYPHQWGRMIFAANNIQKLAPSKDAEILRESLMLRLQLKVEEARDLEKALSPEGRIFLQNVLNRLQPHERARFQTALTEYADLAEKISPQTIVRKLNPKLRIYLLHGYEDDLIPFTETQELHLALKQANHANVSSLVTMVLTHVDPIEGSNSILNSLKLMWWVRSFLNETNRKNPQAAN